MAEVETNAIESRILFSSAGQEHTVRDLGDCEVKHGVRLHLVNLYAEPLGNGALPQKFQEARLDDAQPGVTNLLSDPFLRAYKDDPRFIAFAQKVGVMPKTAAKP